MILALGDGDWRAGVVAFAAFNAGWMLCQLFNALYDRCSPRQEDSTP